MAQDKVFWGLILRPDKRYEQEVEDAFHVSKACLEPGSAGDGITSVYIESGSEEFIVSNLGSQKLSDDLDLNFILGESICFRVEGKGTVHLTGFVHPDDDDDISMDQLYEDTDEEDEEELVPKAVERPDKKRKTSEAVNGSPSKKAKGDVAEAVTKAEAAKKKILAENAKVKKGQTIMDLDCDDDDDDQEDSDDFEDMEDDDDDDDEDDDDDDEDDDVDDEDEDDDDESGDDDDEVAQEVVKPNVKKEKMTPQKKKSQLNGSSKDVTKTPQQQHEDKKAPKTPKTPQQQSDVKTLKTPQSKVKTPMQTGDKKGNKETPVEKKKKTPKRTLKGGVIVEEVKVGTGPEAGRSKMVGVYYEGRLASNNKMFDSNLSGKPFKFKLGMGEVIKGWDVGVEGMKVGGQRKLTVPAKMAYGTEGSGKVIPPNATLVFDVECKFVQ